MSNDKSMGTIAILDLESAPDPTSVGLAPNKGGSGSRVSLHRATGWSVLTAREDVDGQWQDFCLESCSDEDEHTLLMDLDAPLAAAQEASATLVTYNGEAHDLPFVKRRVGANAMWAMPALAALHDMPHRDVMRHAMGGYLSHWPSLRDLAAGYGIPTNHMLGPRNGEPKPTPVRKSQVDVVATFLVLLHDLSFERKSPNTLINGWSALAKFLEHPDLRDPHLSQFRTHHKAALADAVSTRH